MTGIPMNLFHVTACAVHGRFCFYRVISVLLFYALKMTDANGKGLTRPC